MTIRSAAYTTAITALEAQGAAYRSYARLVAAQRDVLANNPQQVRDVTRRAADEFQKIGQRAPEVRAHLEKALSGPDHTSPHDVEHLDRVLQAVQKEAKQAEREVQQLREDLEKWRDSIARELSDFGAGLPTDAEMATQAGATGYGSGKGESRPVILDRQG